MTQFRHSPANENFYGHAEGKLTILIAPFTLLTGEKKSFQDSQTKKISAAHNPEAF